MRSADRARTLLTERDIWILFQVCLRVVVVVQRWRVAIAGAIWQGHGLVRPGGGYCAALVVNKRPRSDRHNALGPCRPERGPHQAVRFAVLIRLQRHPVTAAVLGSVSDFKTAAQSTCTCCAALGDASAAAVAGLRGVPAPQGEPSPLCHKRSFLDECSASCFSAGSGVDGSADDAGSLVGVGRQDRRVMNPGTGLSSSSSSSSSNRLRSARVV